MAKIESKIEKLIKEQDKIIENYYSMSVDAQVEAFNNNTLNEIVEEKEKAVKVREILMRALSEIENL